MTIDIHAHTSNHELYGLHTKFATIDVIENFAKIYDIEKVVLLATYFPLKKSGLTNFKLLERIKGRKLFIAFGSLDIQNNFNGGLSELENLARTEQISGIKLYTGYQDFHPSDRKIFGIYELAQQFNLPVMLHGGETHCGCPDDSVGNKIFQCGYDYCKLKDFQHYSCPTEMIQAFKSFPRVKFIISHLANNYFDELRFAMSSCGNVFTDTSGLFATKTNEDTLEYRLFLISEIKKIVSEIKNGINRILFGTDFPIMSYEDAFSIVSDLKLSITDEQKILSDNSRFILDRSAEVST